MLILSEIGTIPWWNQMNDITFTKTYSWSIIDTVTFYDLVGNAWTTGIAISWIDTNAVVGTVSYDVSSATSGNVTASVSFNKSWVTVTNNGGKVDYFFTNNGEFTFEFIDSYGNTGTAKATVDRIDKTSPTATVEYSLISLTSGNVVATLTWFSELLTITNNGGSNTYVFTGDESFLFTFKDAVGNTGSALAQVTWILNTSPVATVHYSSTGMTNQNVTVSLTFDRPGVIVLNNSGSMEYTFKNNESFTFEFIDYLGNTGSQTITMNSIDKTPIIASLQYTTNINL